MEDVKRNKARVGNSGPSESWILRRLRFRKMIRLSGRPRHADFLSRRLFKFFDAISFVFPLSISLVTIGKRPK
jgi:hypothetical protein